MKSLMKGHRKYTCTCMNTCTHTPENHKIGKLKIYYISSESPLEKANFYFTSMCHLETASWSGVDACVHFPLWVLGLYLAWNSADPLSAATVTVSTCLHQSQWIFLEYRLMCVISITTCVSKRRMYSVWCAQRQKYNFMGARKSLK